MGTATAVKPEESCKLLSQACARNTAAELHFEDLEQGMLSAKVRMLAIADERLYMNRPQAIGKVVKLSAGQPVQVHFLIAGVRYAFDTRIVRPACYVRLNSRQQVPGVALAIPQEVRHQQRRADFRLSLAAYKDLKAQVHAGTPQDGGSCETDTVRITARLLNISAGGIGLVVNAAHARDWRSGEVFFLSFALPEVESPFLMMAELRHGRHIHQGLSMVAGFKFLPWPVVPMMSYGHRIARFIADEQRRQLRRGK